MTRKSLILAIGIVLFLLGSAGAALYLLARYEPAFYVRGNIAPGDQRKALSGECIAEFFKVLNGIARDRGEWEGRLKEEQVNSYFAEDFITNHSVEYPLPDGFSEPRVALEADRIRLGFRYGSGWKSTVISIDMRVWLIAREPNAVALKFERIHAGALPISAQSLLDRVADFAHQKDIEATWYRHNGRPVLVLRFEADKSNPRFRLLQLELRPGMLRIHGKSLDGSARLDLPQDNTSRTTVAKLVTAKLPNS
jgi:hypothetical protein